MPSWRVTVNGTEHEVEFTSPTFGSKTIMVDGNEVAKVGATISMWANYQFAIAGEQATIKFRAIRDIKGVSLVFNDQIVSPESKNAEMSAETVGYLQLGIIVLIVLGLAYGIISKVS